MGSDVDIEGLGAKLKALSSINRLRLMRQLDVPTTVGDIHLTPSNASESENEDRKLTREGVRHHLSRLEEAGLLRSHTRPNDRGRDQREYVVDEPSVFGLIEELRSLVVPGTEAPLDPFQTDPSRGSTQRNWPTDPKLVLVRGAEDDKVFGLEEIETNEDPSRGWVIGRSPRSQISLQFDPYLSSQNSEILREDGGFKVVDLRTSRNGTTLNDERLPPGDPVRLEHGDLIRVGCSALLFRNEG